MGTFRLGYVTEDVKQGDFSRSEELEVLLEQVGPDGLEIELQQLGQLDVLG